MTGGDELQERYCYDCRHFEDRLRSQGGVSWYGDVVLAPPHRMHAAVGIEQTLLAEIRAAPDDDAPRSIYADWLIERGDPLGTFIALQLARAQQRDPVVSEEEQQLLDRHWSAWIGPASAMFEAGEVAFERGLWSAARVTRRPQLDFVAKHEPALVIDELWMSLDVSRDPPSLSAPGFAYVRRLGISCLPELAPRWVERAHAVRIEDVTLVGDMQAPDVRELIGRARMTHVARLALASKKLTFCAERDGDGTYLIRSVVLSEPIFRDAKRWLRDLDDVVDPGVKLMMRDLTSEQALRADELGLRLVRGVRRYSATPKA